MVEASLRTRRSAAASTSTAASSTTRRAIRRGLENAVENDARAASCDELR